jgi:hypothetical protein
LISERLRERYKRRAAPVKLSRLFCGDLRETLHYANTIAADR